ncbi:MAG TPA: Rrf2 family transcriptional regulator [Mycobacteriales bacterium]|jgi:Rrf2 family protein|nr:Rrf2 family transcriptional regulator [Mycobacteriales bacterium]
MHISARSDYAVRAVVVLAAAGSGPTKGETIAADQHIPAKFLEAILGALRQAGIVASRRGAEGGYWLARPAADISVADVIRAVDGPLAEVRGGPPEAVTYGGVASDLQVVWMAVRANIRQVLEQVSVADIAAGELPPHVRDLAADPDVWLTR